MCLSPPIHSAGFFWRSHGWPLTLRALTPCAYAQHTENRTFILSHQEYIDRVKAIWLAQMIGQATGVRFEHQVDSVLPITPPSNLPGYAPVDDDYYYEMVAVRGFERYGIHMSVQQLGQQWLANSAGAWGSSSRPCCSCATASDRPIPAARATTNCGGPSVRNSAVIFAARYRPHCRSR